MPPPSHASASASGARHASAASRSHHAPTAPAATHAAAPAEAPSSSSFAYALAASFTRLGFDDEWTSSSAAAAAVASAGINEPRPALVRELEWVEGALAQGDLSDAQRNALVQLLQGLQPHHALTTHQINVYASLRESHRDISDPIELAQRLDALGLTEAIEQDEEDEDLEAIEREIAALTAESAHLDARVSSLQLSRSQFDARRMALADSQRELDRWHDEELESDQTRLAAAQGQGWIEPSARPRPPLPQPSNRIHSAAELAADVRAFNEDHNRTLALLEHSANQIDSMLVQGRSVSSAALTLNDRSSSGTTRSTATPAMAASTSNGYAALPSLASDDLSALTMDSSAPHASCSTPASFAPSSSTGAVSKYGTSSTLSSASSSSASDSPLVLHHPALLSAYVAQDDAWARALHGLFRAQFGAPPSSGANTVSSAGGNADGSKLASTLRAIEEDEVSQQDMMALLHQTPHAKHLPPPRTPATHRGKIVPRTQRKELATSVAANRGDSFSTPRQQQQRSQQSPTDPDSSAPTSASSLSPSLHVQYSSTLSRLYDRFPDNQSFWLLSNLQYLGSQARLKEQHELMVQEQALRALGRESLNAAIAEASISSATARAQLSKLLCSDFPRLWEELRALQLLEVLRVDLDFKFRRQGEYLQAQSGVISLLLEQRARHELVLGAQRWGLNRMAVLRETMNAALGGLASTGQSSKTRMESYERLDRLHAQSASMVHPGKLGIDSRASSVARIGRMVSSAWGSVGRDPLAKVMLPQEFKASSAATAAAAANSASSYDALLSASQALSAAPAMLRSVGAAQASARDALLNSLARAAAAARKPLFDDGADVRVADNGKHDAAASVANDARLGRDAFSRAQGAAERAVDAAAGELNALLQQQAQLLAQLSPPAASATAGVSAGAISVERELRPVWCEFVQAPDLLDQRVRRLQAQLREAEAR